MATTSHPAAGILAQGDKGPAVANVKQLLERWFEALHPVIFASVKFADNDVFGDNVVKAVRIFQWANALDVDGQVGPNTMKALKARPTPGPKLPDLLFQPGLQSGVAGQDTHVKLVQGWLTLHGFPVGVDGGFGDTTARVVKNFQARRGLPAAGAVDQATWNALVAPMVAALAPVKGKAVGKALATVALQHLKQRPLEVGGANRGPWVRLYTHGQEGVNVFWCAGFATFCLEQACGWLGVKTPVGHTLLCDDMAAAAGFVKGTTPGAVDRLRPGSFFLELDKPGSSPKYKHCGIVLGVRSDGKLDTIEGNSNTDGSNNGIETCRNARSVGNLDFVIL